MQFLNTFFMCRQIFLSFIAAHLYFVTFHVHGRRRTKGGVALAATVAVAMTVQRMLA